MGAVVYEPSAIVTLAKSAGHTAKEATRLLPSARVAVDRHHSRLPGRAAAGGSLGKTCNPRAIFSRMAICIVVSFGWAFYVPAGLNVFIASLFFLGFFGGNFAMYNLWLPEHTHRHPCQRVCIRHVGRSIHRAESIF